jgi:hypothetical protein
MTFIYEGWGMIQVVECLLEYTCIHNIYKAVIFGVVFFLPDKNNLQFIKFNL